MQDVSAFLARHYPLSISIVTLLVILMGIELLRLKRHQVRLSTQRLIQLINKENAVVIDIRSPAIYRQGHIIQAQSQSAKEVTIPNKKLDKYKSRPIIIVCENGVESQKIAALMLKRGYQSYSLSGGMRSWSEANMPLIKE